MTPRLSILVPVYNVSTHIAKCADSLFNQTLDDIEFIFVNDATPDNSIDLLIQALDKYPMRKAHTHIIHHTKNSGSAAAKNTALDHATGKYILFVDSDDYVDADMAECLLYKAEAENADIVVSDIYLEYPDKSILVKERVSANRDDRFVDMIQNEHSHGFMCNKLVKRELYLMPECRLPMGLNYYEDLHVMTRLYFFAQKVCKIEKAFYHYIQYNANAITKTKSRMHFENVVRFWSLLDKFMSDKKIDRQFGEQTAFPKVRSKVRLMIDTHDKHLRKEFANIFLDQEKTERKHFKHGEQLMLFLVRNGFFELAQLYHVLMTYKSKIKHAFTN